MGRRLRGTGHRYLTKTFLVKMTNTTSHIAIVGANVCPIESLDYESATPIAPVFFFFFSRLILPCKTSYMNTRSNTLTVLLLVDLNPYSYQLHEVFYWNLH
jgi:hypothetical protein